jgi:lipopolysaccharide export system permease protein
MTLIDRYILGRFLANFVILLTLLFLFAVVIDLVLALDRFVEAARAAAGEEAGFSATSWSFLRLAVNFQGPRFFQFYAYLHGLVAVGAMAFTLAQMHRHRELVAILASGLSMQRVAMPFVVGVFALSMFQLVNQELFLPRVAPLLLRDHGHIGKESVDEFPIRFTPDGQGNLLQAPSFDPRTQILRCPTFLERDDRGRTIRRITGETARWTEQPVDGAVVEGWEFIGGRVVTLRDDDSADEGAGASLARERLDFYPTDLSPRVLIVRRYGEYATMLSLRQIQEMLDTPGVAEQPSLLRLLLRHRYSRFATVLVNVLVMWLALPTFLIRQPANLLWRSALCAGITLPAMLGAAVFMMADLPGIPAAVGVFLPVAVLLPIVLGQWTCVRT